MVVLRREDEFKADQKTLSQNQKGRSGSSERTCAKITKLS